ncbi:Protein of unknown function, putative hydrolase [Flavobacterium indicum GPTSA100-9 = DSM 17447]|uniref:Metallo-beta-lactamase domain-containing protein n=1 Tax=Flavobacterium indicum (strain DSM 17447 / CIP 109464 / GPTSA100-9) TaxID=1094466 RepID=H8XSS3_FLAIG|nr:hypothetical protein [Flavobacterium indicum]CCG53465.1 Protein of unknown function, putative hydrolase [Flavobacterium indicum GPTSA100-9 = DSM 17447]
MYYYYYNKYYPQDVLVVIEEVNWKENYIIFDFLDSEEFLKFDTFLEIQHLESKTSMVKIVNYSQKRVRENTIYAINKEVFSNLNDSIEIIEDSYLFGYTINLSQNSIPFFLQSVSFNIEEKFNIGAIARGNLSTNFLDIKLKDNIEVNVRDVGQGNWNEIINDKIVKVVYDVGAPMNASKSIVRGYIGNKTIEYSQNKPILVLSHWDKDHYHSLIGMTNLELQCFSSFICPSFLPNITSRILFSRIVSAIGINNVLTIHNLPKLRGIPPILDLISPPNNKLKIFNSTENKDRNKSGIVLAIVTSKSSIIMPADCHYELISNFILPLINHTNLHSLIVPHHGGKAGLYNYNLSPGSNPNLALISVGKNRYGHPMAHYTNSLTLDGFKVISTQDLTNDILIQL